MYAIKEAVIAKEHSKEPLDTAIFYMDMRTYGKDFEKYYNRAEHERGVRFIRSRVHSIEAAEKDNLRIRFATESGEVKEEDFDMVVLSVGLAPLAGAADLAQKLGLDLEEHQYAHDQQLLPCYTTREGIDICGGFQAPKNIPQSVMEASLLRSGLHEVLAEARGSLTRSKELPPELDVSGQDPTDWCFRLQLRNQHWRGCRCACGPGLCQDPPLMCFTWRTISLQCSQDTQEKDGSRSSRKRAPQPCCGSFLLSENP